MNIKHILRQVKGKYLDFADKKLSSQLLFLERAGMIEFVFDAERSQYEKVPRLTPKGSDFLDEIIDKQKYVLPK